MMIRKILCLSALLLATRLVYAQDKVTLMLNLEPGDSYLSTIDMKQDNKQTIDGEEQTLTQEMLMSWVYDVTGRNKSGDMDIKLTYKRVKVSQNYGHQMTAYDSESPPEFLDPSMRGMAVLPGTQLSVKLDSKGKVLNIDGIKEMLDKMISAMQLPDSPNKDAVLTDLRRQFGEDAMKQSIEQVTWFYPDKPVAVGESWQTSFDLKAAFPMKAATTYTLKSIQNSQAQIDLISEIQSDTTSPLKMGQLSMIYNISGGQDGSMNVHAPTGLPLSSAVSLHYAGNINVSGVPDQPSQTWPISATGTVRITFQKQ